MAERHGWQIVEVYEDAGVSGAMGREEQPASAAYMLQAASIAPAAGVSD